MKMFALLFIFYSGFVFAEGPGIKVGNAREYKLSDCNCSSESEVRGNPKQSADAQSEADVLFEKMRRASTEKNIIEAKKNALLGIEKGYVQFYEEMYYFERDDAATNKKKSVEVDATAKEWLIKGAEKGSNSCVGALATEYEKLYSKTKNREAVKERYFWTYLGRKSGYMADATEAEGWEILNKQITAKEKTEVTTKAQAWMKQHNWPAITR